jgi:hypothetical protein
LLGPGGNASIQNGNAAAIYQAVLPSTNFDNATGSTITGSIVGTASYNGTGVAITVNFTGFPSESEYGPFGKTTTSSFIGSVLTMLSSQCTISTVCQFQQMGIAQPRWATSIPQTEENITLVKMLNLRLARLETWRASMGISLEVAFLQGEILFFLPQKWSEMILTSGWNSYIDLYLSTIPGSPYFFGDKSIVIHSTNTTRLTCANFTLMSAATSSGAMPSSTSPTFTGAASGMNSITPGVLGSLMFFLTFWL